MPKKKKTENEMTMNSELKRDLQLLDLNEDYSLEELKSSFKLHAKVWHPDRFQHDKELSKQASEKLAEINNAYQNLKDYLDNSDCYTGEYEEDEEFEESESYEKPDETIVEPEVHAGASNRRTKLRKVFLGICIFCFSAFFLLIGIIYLDLNGYLGNERDPDTGTVMDVLPEGLDSYFLVPLIFAGTFSYHMMRRYSDNSEKYY